jgi:hypothetical protein
LRQRFVEDFGDLTSDLTCHIVKPLRHGNANLHAQAGVFTLCRGTAVRANGRRFVALDELLDLLVKSGVASDAVLSCLPCLRRFRLPTSEARALLADLHHDQIDAVTLFPGYGGVVRALREAHWLDEDASLEKEDPLTTRPGLRPIRDRACRHRLDRERARSPSHRQGLRNPFGLLAPPRPAPSCPLRRIERRRSQAVASS